MLSQTFAALATFNQSAALVGFASIVLFAIVGVVVGPDYDGMNAPAVKKDWTGIEVPIKKEQFLGTALFLWETSLIELFALMQISKSN